MAEQLLAALQAARSQDNAQRAAAEAFLQQVESSNAAAYFMGLSDILKDDARADDVRQLAGLMIKNALSAEDEGIKLRKEGNWRSIALASRGAIKQSLLAALASPKSEPARTAAAMAIAKAGGIDVPANEWPDILPMLLGAAMNPALEPGVKAATLKCLGYLLEELPGEAVEQPTVNQVLTAIVDALAPGRAPEVVRAGATALYSALDFAGENFEDTHAAERNALMTAMCSATQSGDTETRSGGFDCIIRVAELFYNALGPYMNTLAQLTFGAANAGATDEASAVRAVEFWSTVADAEADMDDADPENRKYTLTALSSLVEMLTTLMLTVREEDDEDAYGPSQAAASCLGAVARVAKDAILEHVMPFVNGNFGSPKWEGREAATLAMGVVMEGPSPAAVAALVNKALPPMLDRLVRGGAAYDASAAVRDTTAWTIGHAFNLLFEHLDMNALFARTIEVLKGSLEDEPRVAQNAAYALHNVAQHCGHHVDEATRASPLSPHLMPLIGALMARCDRDDWDEWNLRSVCYETINMMVESAAPADEPVLLALLQEAARRLQASLGKPLASADDREEQGGLQVLLTAMIQTIVLELGEAVKSGADVLVALLLRVFDNKQSGAVEEAYRALGAVATGVAADFARFMPAVFPRLLEGIANTAEYQVCNATVWCVGEVCRALEGGIEPFVQPLADALLRALASQELHRSVKPPAIGVIGDLALAAGPALEPHLRPVSLLLEQAASTPLPSDADEDLVEYISELRKAVIEAWVGMFQGYNNEASKPKAKILTNMATQSVLPKLEQWAKDQSKMDHFYNEAAAKGEQDEVQPPNCELCVGIVGLLGDMSTVLGKPSLPVHKSTDWVKALFVLTDKLEKASWGDETHDEDGKPKKTTSSWAKGLL